MPAFKIKATVITPVSIGDGEELSPYKDYFIKDAKVHYVDDNKLVQLLSNSPELFDIYIEGVANMEGNRSRFDLQKFLFANFKNELGSVIKFSIPFYGNGDVRKLPIQKIIKSPNGNPYIPGSSIKGAIKTAFLMNDLRVKTEIIHSVLENSDETGKIEELLNKYKLSVSDSELLEINNHACFYESRLNLKKGIFVIPAYREGIKENSCFKLEIDLSHVTPNTWVSFCEVINEYAKSGIETEKAILNDIDCNYDKLDRGAYNTLFDFYEDLSQEIEANHQAAYIRIGFGKGYYMNSVGVLLFDADNTEGKSKFKAFLKGLGYGKVYNPQKKMIDDFDLDPYEFPLTRNTVKDKILPLGWVKLEKIN